MNLYNRKKAILISTSISAVLILVMLSYKWYINKVEQDYIARVKIVMQQYNDIVILIGKDADGFGGVFSEPSGSHNRRTLASRYRNYTNDLQETLERWDKTKAPSQYQKSHTLFHEALELAISAIDQLGDALEESGSGSAVTPRVEAAIETLGRMTSRFMNAATEFNLAMSNL